MILTRLDIFLPFCKNCVTFLHYNVEKPQDGCGNSNLAAFFIGILNRKIWGGCYSLSGLRKWILTLEKVIVIFLFFYLNFLLFLSDVLCIFHRNSSTSSFQGNLLEFDSVAFLHNNVEKPPMGVVKLLYLLVPCIEKLQLGSHMVSQA